MLWKGEPMRAIKGRSFYKEPWYNSYRCMYMSYPCWTEKDVNALSVDMKVCRTGISAPTAVRI